MIPKDPKRGSTNANVMGTEGVPYNSLANQSAPPELVSPRRIKTKNAGLRKHKPVSSRVRAIKRGHAAADCDGLGNAVTTLGETLISRCFLTDSFRSWRGDNPFSEKE